MKLKDSIVSVLAFTFANELQVRITRSYGFDQRPTRVNIYHATVRDDKRIKRLAKLASKLNELVLLKMVDNYVCNDALKGA